MRRLAVERRKEADPIGCWIPTDARLSAMTGPMGPTKRLAIMGRALMDVIEANKPMFHYSVVHACVVRTEGTTIFVTGRTHDDGETIVGTWDYGQPVIEAVRRLSRIRSLLRDLPSEVAYQMMKAMEFPNLPPPQALISDCIVANEREPQTSLFGCGAGAPISIAVGVEKIHFCLDHRLMDPMPHMRVLVEGFKANLEREFKEMRGNEDFPASLNGTAAASTGSSAEHRM